MSWFAALGQALIGRPLPERSAGAPEVSEVVDALAEAGYDRERLAAFVAQRQATGQPWPFPVRADQRPGIGAAQFMSVLRAVTDALEVHTWRSAQPSSGATPTAADRRLMADRPPHWG